MLGVRQLKSIARFPLLRATTVGDSSQHHASTTLVDLRRSTDIWRRRKLKDLVLKDGGGRTLLTGFFYALIGTFSALGQPLGFAKVLDALIQGANPIRLRRALAAVGCLYAFESIFTYLYVRCMSRLNEKVVSKLRVESFKAILSQDMVFFDENEVSSVVQTLSADMAAVRNTVKMNLTKDRGVRAAMEGVMGLVVLVWLQWRLAWIFGLFIPVAAISLAETRKKLLALAGVEAANLGKETGVASEVIRNIREVRSFGTEDKELSRFQRTVASSVQCSTEVGDASGSLEALNRAAIYASITSVLYFGGKLVATGAMQPTLLVSFIGYCFSLNFAVQGVNVSLADFRTGWQALSRVLDLTSPRDKDATMTKKIRPGNVEALTSKERGLEIIPTQQFLGKVTFNKVSFKYPTRPDVHVIKELNLTLPPGKVTALVGFSGAGKSTIANLLSNFYTPDSGKIKIDGVDMRDLDRKWLTQRVALVSQQPALFSGTLAYNIAYGARQTNKTPDPNDVLNGTTMDKVEEAARQGNADNFIRNFPLGYDTQVGEQGAALSGGQRQRVAIARAILKDAKILILDEATASLDAQSEALVQEALERLMRGKTVLVIAHRLSTVVKADKICVIKAGTVIEEGTHEELLSRGGSYSQLMKTQVNSYSVIKE